MYRLLIAILALSALVARADAHPGHAFSFLAGLEHPVSGLDHLAAMVAVGLWAALAGGRRLWVWPVAFVSAMLAGGALGASGIELPFVEPAIAASVVILGLLIALLVKAPTAAGAALIAAFGIAHGYAHGMEAPATGWLGYAAGFALATALLHVAGIGLGLTAARIAAAPRALGLATAAAGLLVLMK
jgi:urease accessory protein